MVGEHIVRYLRHTQSSTALRLALAEIAQLQILEEDDTLVSMYQNGNNTVYTFENSTIMTDYAHEELTVGTLYPKETIVGEEYIRVYSQNCNCSEQWWRVLDWNAGLPLTGVWEGLTIPDGLVRFYWVSDWVDSEAATRKHIRADFDQTDTDLLDAFWYQVHTGEEWTEKTLQDTDELADVDNGTDVNVNMIDLYFRHMWGYRAIVVDLKTGDLGSAIDNAVQNFLKRETPIGSTVIIRIDGEIHPDFL
jgi:hypothetical protein